MAHYVATVRSPWAAAKAFDYLSDFRNFTEWDPGVTESKIIHGEKPGPGTVYAVTVKKAVLDYETLTHRPPEQVVIEGTSRFFYSYDVLDITDTADGCDVRYDATLKLRSFAAILNPLLGLYFDRLGDPAAAGLATALDGTQIA